MLPKERRFPNRRCRLYLAEMAKGTIIAYWLCPSEPARSEIMAVIARLAAQLDAPVFEPHVTIYVTNAEHENPESTLANAASGRGAYRLRIRGLDFSDKFTKTLFLQFEPDAELTRLSEDLRRASTSKDDYQLNPHVSLIYKNLNTETKRQLAESIVLPFAEVAFDTIKAIVSPAEIKSRAEVEAWRVAAERRLVP